MQDYIIQSLQEGVDLKTAVLNDEKMMHDLETVGCLMTKALESGHKILLCGNGGSAADAQHIAAELVGRFITDRRGLPAIAFTTDTSILTAVSNDYGYDYVFERQVEALGNQGDLLIGLSTSGNSPNVERALKRARQMGIITIGLLGRNGGSCKALCDYEFTVPHQESARIQEIHITLGHILCGIVDHLISRT